MNGLLVYSVIVALVAAFVVVLLKKWGVIFGEKGAKDDLILKMKEILWQ